MLRQALGSSITVDNDVNLAAIGERVFGCGTTIHTFVFLSVGTGIGMGIIINGVSIAEPMGLVERSASYRLGIKHW